MLPTIMFARQRKLFVRFLSINIYTDGSCLNNGKSFARGGIGIYFPNSEHPNLSITYPTKGLLIPPTSQRCELLAVNYSLIIHWLCFRNKECIIHTDSEYTIKALTNYCNVWIKNGWKKTNGEDVKNQDLLKPMHVLFAKNGNVKFHFVKAHSGLLDKHSLNNNIADAFARKGLGFNS
jgi:ribonuclease HI